MAVPERGAGWRARLSLWRPEPRTAAVLIGGFFVYFAVLGINHVRADLGFVTESCGNLEIPCDDVHLRLVAAGGLLATLAELAVVLGCALLLAAVRRSSWVIAAGAALLAAGEVIIALDWLPFPGGTLASPLIWQPLVAAAGAVLLALLVLRLPAGSSP